MAAGAVAGAFGQTTLVGDSPFAPAGSAGAAAASSAEAYELAGSSVQGPDVLVCIFDRGAKHSDWIAVGGTAGAVHVVSYDADKDRAVVTISGARKELTLRTATVASAGAAPAGRQAPPSPRPAPQVVAGAPPVQGPAANAAREQQEARMLVSDLLDIGVQQRKAYQEARQKAAQAPSQPAN